MSFQDMTKREYMDLALRMREKLTEVNQTLEVVNSEIEDRGIATGRLVKALENISNGNHTKEQQTDLAKLALALFYRTQNKAA